MSLSRLVCVGMTDLPLGGYESRASDINAYPLYLYSLLHWFRRRQLGKRRGIKFSIKVFSEAIVENLVVSSELSKQGHRRAKFQVVGIAENIFDRSAING